MQPQIIECLATTKRHVCHSKVAGLQFPNPFKYLGLYFRSASLLMCPQTAAEEQSIEHPRPASSSSISLEQFNLLRYSRDIQQNSYFS